MSLDKLEKIIELVRRHGIHQVQVEEGGVKISVTATPPNAGAPGVVAPSALYPSPLQHHVAPQFAAPAPAPQPTAALHVAPAPTAEKKAAAAGGKLIKSPFVGTFYRSPSPGSDPFCERFSFRIRAAFS